MFTQVPQTNKSLTPVFAGIPPNPTIEIAEARPGGVPGRALQALLAQHGYRTTFFSPVKLGFQNKRGLLRSTLFVIVADHGEAFGEHGALTHGNVVWEEGLKIPALLFSPRLFPGGGPAIAGYRQHLDLLPTVADALNYDLEGGRLPARSLLKPPLASGRSLHHITRNPNWGVVLRRNSMAYLYFYRRRPLEIYNTAADPKEERDLADQFSGPERRSVEREVLRWRRSVARSNAGARGVGGGSEQLHRHISEKRHERRENLRRPLRRGVR